MNKQFYFLFFFLLSGFTFANSDILYFDTYSGFIDCSVYENEPCELSSLNMVGENTLVAFNDKKKTHSDISEFIKLKYTPEHEIKFDGYLKSYDLDVSKIESSVRLPDGRLLIASSFDRFKSDRSLDSFNSLFLLDASEVKNPTYPFILKNRKEVSLNKNIVYLRNAIAKALSDHLKRDISYFKVEGLTILNGNLLMGVREVGQDYKSFDCVSIIIKIPYLINADELILGIFNSIAVVADFTEVTQKSVGSKVGISSIDINPFNHKMYFLTTFEGSDTEPLKSYLWTTSIYANGELDRNGLSLAQDKFKTTLELPHKFEGLAFVNPETIVMVADDDRRLVPLSEGSSLVRRANQAAFYILRSLTFQDTTRVIDLNTIDRTSSKALFEESTNLKSIK